MPAFPGQQTTLAFKAISITAKATIRPDNAVARNEHCNRICTIGRSSRAHGIWFADCSGNFCVIARFASRYLQKCLPNVLLEPGAADIQR